jgi:uroporphyrin-III C-methyltransferase / precorrin-2 dehydrogenase / sirohydrochlorin ferrochelatase
MGPGGLPYNPLHDRHSLSIGSSPRTATMDYLPVFLRLRAAPAVVVGGGRIAARKAEWLLRAGARVTVISPDLLPELRAQSDLGRLQHRAARFNPEHLDGAALAVSATGDPAVNRAVSEAARTRGIPVNVVDAPELSTFIFPAIIDRSPLVVAVSSAGSAPVLARRVREWIEALLPARLGALARFMGERRREVRRALGTLARRAFWERIVSGAVADRLLAGEVAPAEEAFARELLTSQLTVSRATSTVSLGEVYLIGAGPGDSDLLTLRALQLLQQADVILYDRLVPGEILERARRDAERIFVGKDVGDRGQQQHINELLVGLARQGKRVARLKGGDPFVFGRGGEELEVLNAHGIPWRVVPGITAALGAAAAAGMPLTHRALSQSVTLVSGHADADLDWRALAAPGQTVVFYMGVTQLPRIVAQLREAGAAAELPAAIIERATLPGQRVLRARLADIALLARHEQVTAPALLIVGPVTALTPGGAEAQVPADPATPQAAAPGEAVRA